MSENVTGEETPTDPMKAVADALEKAVQTASDTAAEAKASFEKSLPGASRFLSRLVYTTCYSVSYGVVFPTIWVARSIPSDNALVNGLTDGAKAAIESVEQMKNRQLSSPADVVPTVNPS